MFLVGSFVKRQIDELKQIEYADVLEEGFDEHDVDVKYDTEEVFTLGIFIGGTSSDREIIEGFSLIRLDPVSRTADIIVIDAEIYMSILSIPGKAITRKDVSTARIKDLMVIGELQTPPMLLAFPVYELEELLALHVDGYLMITDEISDDIGNLALGETPMDRTEGIKGYEKRAEEMGSYWVEFLNNVSVLSIWRNRAILPKIESNMEVMDVYRFIKVFGAIPDDGVIVRTVSDSALSEQIDERGNTVNLVTPAAVDEILSEIERDERMNREQARIEIFNGTSINGLGSRFERWITHVGGEVIRVKNAPGRVERTKIYVTDPQDYEYSVGRVSSLFETAEIVEGRPEFITTGDIIIVIGMDF